MVFVTFTFLFLISLRVIVTILSMQEMSEAGLAEWLDLCHTKSGLLVCSQRWSKPPCHVAEIIAKWLSSYT